MNIYFLQETHCINETESKFQSDWGDKCIFSNKNSQLQHITYKNIYTKTFQGQIWKYLWIDQTHYVHIHILLLAPLPIIIHIYWLKEKKMNIYFLQETHCNNETESKFQSNWGDKCIFSNGLTRHTMYISTYYFLHPCQSSFTFTG
jgi:hypothetical protein